MLPEVAAIDLRAHPPERGRFLAPPLVAAIRETLARGEQAMLFLNRRGYAPLTLCRACGHRMACPHCTAWLVEHRARRVLQCHHCGHAVPIPETCPDCGAAHSLTAVGPGVERITEEAAALFPDARRLVMASDTLPGPDAAAAAARAIAAREVDLIIGTQIVAKGWHFPHLTLVGVVDADLGLGGGDLRAGERTVQLLHQVAGRAGRAEAPGRVLLQTFSPGHPVMAALVEGDLAGFVAREAEARRPGFWPPYGRLAALIVSAEEASAADALAGALGRAAPSGPGMVVLGPAPAPLSRAARAAPAAVVVADAAGGGGAAGVAGLAGAGSGAAGGTGGGGCGSGILSVRQSNREAPEAGGMPCPRPAIGLQDLA